MPPPGEGSGISGGGGAGPTAGFANLTRQQMTALEEDKPKGELMYAFEIHLANEGRVIAEFAPDDLCLEAQRIYLESLPDVTAFPDCALPSPDSQALSQFTESMASIIAMTSGRALTAGNRLSVLETPSWTALLKVKSAEDVEELAQELLSENREYLSNVVANMSAAYEWQGELKAMARSKALLSLLYRVIKTSFEGYLSLVLHLRGLPGGAIDWEKYVKPEVEHWTKAINKVRTSASGPLCLILRIYTLFRDGMDKSWASTRRVDQRLQLLEQGSATRAEGLIDGADRRPGPGYRHVWQQQGTIAVHPCSHCSLVHRTTDGKMMGDDQCPLKDLPIESRMKVARLIHQDPAKILANWDALKKKRKKKRRQESNQEDGAEDSEEE